MNCSFQVDTLGWSQVLPVPQREPPKVARPHHPGAAETVEMPAAALPGSLIPKTTTKSAKNTRRRASESDSLHTRRKGQMRRSNVEGRSSIRPRPRVSVFGFRPSAFFRPSGFGLRTSTPPIYGQLRAGSGSLLPLVRSLVRLLLWRWSNYHFQGRSRPSASVRPPLKNKLLNNEKNIGLPVGSPAPVPITGRLCAGLR